MVAGKRSSVSLVPPDTISRGTAHRATAASASEPRSWTENGVAVTRVSGPLDIASSSRLWASVRDATAQGTGPFTVVDLTPTSFLDSFGVATLLELDKNLRRKGSALRLVVPETHVARRILRLSGVERVLQLYTSLSEALVTPSSGQDRESRATAHQSH